jgi:hypothetical protein
MCCVFRKVLTVNSINRLVLLRRHIVFPVRYEPNLYVLEEIQSLTG